MIYIIRAEGTNYYKIGYTENVKKRLKGLQTGCPNKLSIIKTYNGGQIKERQIQEHFKAYKTREQGEWFEFCNKALIKKVCEKIKSSYKNSEDDMQNYYKELIESKIDKFIIKDIIISSDGNEFYISWGIKKEKVYKRYKKKETSRQKLKNKEEHNKRQRDWYLWRKRAKKIGVSQMVKNRPTPEQREEWKNKIREAEDIAIILKKQ